MITTTYSMYGVNILLRCDAEVMACTAKIVLGTFEAHPTSEEEPQYHLDIVSVSNQQEMEAGVACLVSGDPFEAEPQDVATRPYRLIRFPQGYVVQYGDFGYVVQQYAQHRTTVFVVCPEQLHTTLRVQLCYLGLTQLLRMQGLYSVHGCGVETKGKGVLLVGKSGQGKTTSGLALIRSGFRSLSDDHPLLRNRAGMPEMLSFPHETSVTETSRRFFPELYHAENKLYRGKEKWSFQLRDIYADACADQCTLKLILFPSVVDACHSRVTPLSGAEALKALLPQAMTVLHKGGSRQEFDFWSGICAQVPVYKLHFGRDMEQLPELVTSLLG